MSDALPHPPSFDDMVGLIKKLFTDYLEDHVKSKPSEIAKSWERYKTLNHLYQDEPLPHTRKELVEEEWESFWKEIVCNPDGTINIEQVKKELYDFSFLMEQVPKIYMHITGGRMSKVMYHADTVISVADDHFQEQLEEAVKEELGDREPAAGREETEGVKAMYDALTTIYGTMIDPVMARQRSADMLNMANQALCKYDKERKGEVAGREEDWISVDERLPEEGGRYWCYVEEITDLGRGYFQWNCAYNQNGKLFTDKSLCNGERITHWQPLPAPPKFKQQKEK